MHRLALIVVVELVLAVSILLLTRLLHDRVLRDNQNFWGLSPSGLKVVLFATLACHSHLALDFLRLQLALVHGLNLLTSLLYVKIRYLNLIFWLNQVLDRVVGRLIQNQVCFIFLI